MAIPGLFIEYLVSGAVALIWLYPLLKSVGMEKPEAAYIPLYVLGFYVLGMMIDFVAWAITRLFKKTIRDRAEKKYGIPAGNTHGASIEREIRISVESPELAKEMSMRSSRDRIARGTFVNAILATVFVLPLVYGVIACVFTFVMWWGFESVSYKFSLKATQVLQEKKPK